MVMRAVGLDPGNPDPPVIMDGRMGADRTTHGVRKGVIGGRLTSVGTWTSPGS